MRLRRLDLLRYGKFTDFSIDFGDQQPGAPDLHIVYGLNEAGKSTSLSAYLDLLFGIEERSRYNFLHPYPAMEIGAVLEFSDKRHSLRRVKGRTNSLRDERGQAVSEALLSTPLGGLTRDAYRMMFSLDDQTLEDGGNAILESRGDLGELLFSASTGLADIGRTLEAIRAEADGIYRKSASSTHIAVLKRQLGDLKTRRDGIDIQASAHAALVAELERATLAYEEANTQLGRLRQEQEANGRMIRALPLAHEHARISEALAGMDHLPRPPARWSSELSGLMLDETRLLTRHADLEQRIARLRTEIDAIAVDTEVLGLADQIEALADNAARFRTAEDDLPKRRQTLLEQQARIGAITRSLGRTGEPDPSGLLVSAALAGALRALIEQRSGIDAHRQSADQELSRAQLALDAARQEQLALTDKRPAIDDARLARLQASIAAASQSNLPAAERIQVRDLQRLQRELDLALAALRPWSGTAEELPAVAMPTAGQINAWRSDIAATETRSTHHQANRRELLARQAEQLGRLKRLRAMGAVDDTAAAEARTARNAAWSQHLHKLDRDSAAAFEAALQTDDQVNEARLANAQATAELRSLSIDLEETIARLEQEEATLAQIAAELEGLRAAIGDSLPAELDHNRDARPRQWLEQIDHWRAGWERAALAHSELQAAIGALEDTRAELAREQEAVASALSAAGLDAAALNLPALLQAAENFLTTIQAEKTAREAAEKTLRERERELLGRRQARDEALSKHQNWQNSWSAMLGDTWFADQSASIGAIRAILDALVDLAAELRQHEETEHRIAAMERDQGAFCDRLAELHRLLGDPFDPQDAVPAAAALSQRHQQSLQSLRRRQDRQGELEQLTAEQEALAQELAIHVRRKAEMLQFFSASDLSDVDAALARCAQRDQLELEHNKLASRITAEMNVTDLEQALHVLAEVDRAALDEDTAVLAGKLEDLDERRRTLFADKTSAADRLAAIGGDDAVARIEAERRTVLLQIEDLALRFVQLRAGGLVAEHALHAYREQHRSSMMQRASDAFQVITRGQYSGLTTRPQKEGEALIGLGRGGGSKLATDMSKGTRFQLYLALRLAGYAEFAAVRPSVPFIADDIMETFDEPRSEEVFRLFAQMASIGQVIYLTHHRHLCDIAQQVVPGVKIHQITGTADVSRIAPGVGQ